MTTDKQEQNNSTQEHSPENLRLEFKQALAKNFRKQLVEFKEISDKEREALIGLLASDTILPLEIIKVLTNE